MQWTGTHARRPCRVHAERDVCRTYARRRTTIGRPAQVPNNLHCMAGLTTPPPQHTRTHTSTAVCLCAYVRCPRSHVRSFTTTDDTRPPAENKSGQSIRTFFFCSRCEGGAGKKHEASSHARAEKMASRRSHDLSKESSSTCARKKSYAPHHTTRSRTQTQHTLPRSTLLQVAPRPGEKGGGPHPVL